MKYIRIARDIFRAKKFAVCFGFLLQKENATETEKTNGLLSFSKEHLMKKFVCLLLALVVAMSLAACSGNWTSTVKEYGGEVSDNGGFAVVKGDYVYFVNGKEDYTADNEFGKVVKGGIVRVKKSELAKAASLDAAQTAACEVVVPKLVYTDYSENGNGFYIFGDYIYYVTPSDDLNKLGEVQNTVAEFSRIRIDGKEEKIIATANGLSTPYRFFPNAKDKNKAYLTVYTTDSDNNNVLITYDETGEEIKRSNAISSYIFSTDIENKYAFYEKKAHDDVQDTDYSFNEVYRYALDGSADELVLSGAGSLVANTDGVGYGNGVTYSFKAFSGNELYFSETAVDTSSSTVTRYFAAKTEDFAAVKVEKGVADYKASKANYDKVTKEVLASGEDIAATVFSSSSVYVSTRCILFNHTDYGIVKYDYKNDEPGAHKQTTVLYDKDLSGYTYKYDDGTYMYYLDSSNYLYRVKIADLVNSDGTVRSDAKDAKIEKLNHYAAGSFVDWYKPEFVDNYMLIANLNEPYNNYVYVIDLDAETTVKNDDDTEETKKVKDLTKDELKDYEDELNKLDREHILKKASTVLGVKTDADKKTFDEYMDSNYPEEDED